MRAGTPLKIYFALPEGKYDGGFQFVASMADGTKMTIKSSSTINIVRGQITKVKNDVNYTLFASGSGTESDPYILKTADHWNNMVAIVNKGEETYQKAYYQLGAEIDFNNKPVTPINIFKGVIDGYGHTLKNAKIGGETASNQAFFQDLYGTVKNLNFEMINVNAGVASSAAVVAAGKTYKCAIENCHVTNSVVTTADDGGNAAGLIAKCTHSEVIISGCSVSNSIITAGTENVGGVVGFLEKGTVDCVESSDNTITGGTYVGGVVGKLEAATLINVKSTSNTTSVNKASCGGVIGVCTSADAKIINIFSDNNIVKCLTHNNAPCLGLIMGGYKENKSAYDFANTLTLTGTADYVWAPTEASKKFAAAVGIVMGYGTTDIDVVSSYYYIDYQSKYDAKFFGAKGTDAATTNALRFAKGAWYTSGTADNKAGSDTEFNSSSEKELTDGTVLKALNDWVEANKETYPTLKSWAAGEDDFPTLILSETATSNVNSLNVVESNY